MVSHLSLTLGTSHAQTQTFTLVSLCCARLLCKHSRPQVISCISSFLPFFLFTITMLHSHHHQVGHHPLSLYLDRLKMRERDNLCTLDGVCLSVVVRNIISISLQLTHWRQTVTAELLLSYQQMKKTKTKKAPHTTRCPSTQDKTKSLRALHFHYFFLFLVSKAARPARVVMVQCVFSACFNDDLSVSFFLFLTLVLCSHFLSPAAAVGGTQNTAVILQRRSRKKPSVCLAGVSAAAAVFTATLTSGELSSHSLPLFFSRFDQISRASSVVTSGPLYLSYTNSISLAGFHCKQTSAAVVASFFGLIQQQHRRRR